MRRLGTIVRIQIQVGRLKVGEEPRRVYDPGGIRAVESVWVGREGLVAPVAAGYLLDVHHQAHPHTRNRKGENALSLGFTGHYDLMRARFGERMALGVAGENFIIDRADVVSPAELAGGVLIRLADGGELRLDAVLPAPPCAPFANWALGFPEGGADRKARKEALASLCEGMRGFYARVAAVESVPVGLGDEVWGLG
ncbi:MAG: hypothetical protein HYZ13_09340 [Acidobacteria bacterium]|nr:hypothetical protein [Acidobacteriota bacterium]